MRVTVQRLRGRGKDVSTARRVAISSRTYRRLSVSSPTRVSHAGLGHEGLVEVDLGLGEMLPQGSDLTDLLENVDLTWLVTINLETWWRRRRESADE